MYWFYLLSLQRIYFLSYSFYGGIKLKTDLNITFNTIFNPFKTLSIMVNTQQAQMQLDELKHGVIGLFKSRNSNVFELVTDVNDNDTIDVIRITQFGAIQKEHNLPIHYGTLKLFPDNMNMFEMLDNPFDWNDFINSFPAKK